MRRPLPPPTLEQLGAFGQPPRHRQQPGGGGDDEAAAAAAALVAQLSEANDSKALLEALAALPQVRYRCPVCR